MLITNDSPASTLQAKFKRIYHLGDIFVKRFKILSGQKRGGSREWYKVEEIYYFYFPFHKSVIWLDSPFRKEKHNSELQLPGLYVERSSELYCIPGKGIQYITKHEKTQNFINI